MKKIISEGIKLLLSLSIEIAVFVALMIFEYYRDVANDKSSKGFEILTMALFSLAFGLAIKANMLNEKINKILSSRILSISDSLNKVPSISDFLGLILKTFSSIEDNKIENRDLSTRLTNLILERNIQHIQTETLEIFASDLGDPAIKNFLHHCAQETVIFKGTCLTKMDSFWFNNVVGPDFFCMNLEYMKANKGFKTERIFVVETNDWREEEKAKLDLIKLMTKNEMKCYIQWFVSI